jgi:hypothetical protein
MVMSRIKSKIRITAATRIVPKNERTGWKKRNTQTGRYTDQSPSSKSIAFDGSAQREAVILPPSGPSNIIVRTANPLPVPKDVDSQ